MAGDINGTHEKAFKQMLILDSLRGEDSTGILGVKKHDEFDYTIAKQVGNPFEVLDTSAAKSIFAGSSRILLGHNRFATQGKINKGNSHPYDFDGLVGAHNGSLSNKWQLHKGGEFEVDSQALFNHIDVMGVEDALRKAEGAFALVWWDKNENTINFIRNKERPLYYTLIDGKVLAWASEDWMLDVALGRNGLKYAEVQTFDVGMLYTVDIPKGGVLGKPVVKPVEFAAKKEPVIYQHNARPVNSPVNNNANNGVKNNSESNDRVFTSPAGQTGGTKPDVGFLQTRGLLMEAVCIVEEPRTGAEYVLCFAPDKPNYEIRLYRHQGCDKVFNDIGCEFEGDINSFMALGEGKSYYKISPHSVKIITHGYHYRKAAAKNADVNETYPNHLGRDISYQEWRKEYGACSFCTDNIEPTDLEEGARFTVQGYCFCKGCAEDPEVAQFTTFI